MNYKVTQESPYETAGEAIEAAAKSIRTMKTDLNESAVTIGALVHGTICRGNGLDVLRNGMHQLAKLTKMPTRKLGYCHEAYLVTRIAGDDLTTGLPKVSFDLYRQFSRVLKATSSLEWKREAILKVASKVADGLPPYLAGRQIDSLLAAIMRRIPLWSRPTTTSRFRI